ncbi:MAG: hypothetical protein VZS44_04665 [Bacilli bacterium]|nr:hypothetical protein [Bacilli bacterium]
MSLKVSKKYILSIDEFMDNFLRTPYTGKNKLTHKEMKFFLKEKKKDIPKIISFRRIKQEDILRGKYLLVKDDVGKKIAYENPQKLDLILNELLLQQSAKANSHQEQASIESKLLVKPKKKILSKATVFCKKNKE